MKSHRYNGNTTIGSHRQSFIRSPTISTDMESAVPIWSLIGISEQEYNYRFNMPIKIEQKIKEEELLYDFRKNDARVTEDEVPPPTMRVVEDVNPDELHEIFNGRPSWA